MPYFCSLIDMTAAVRGQVPQEADYEMELCIQEVQPGSVWGSTSQGNEGSRMNQGEKLSGGTTKTSADPMGSLDFEPTFISQLNINNSLVFECKLTPQEGL